MSEPNWNGSRLPSGHIMLSIYGRAMLEHRYVMEQILGRPLGRWEFVHHIDNDPGNNDPTNLVVVTPAEHSGLHTRLFRSPSHQECGRCRQIKPIELFPKPKSGKSRSWRCRLCKREMQREAR